MNLSRAVKGWYWPARRALHDARIALRESTPRLKLKTAEAFAWRRLLWRTTFVAISGSVGKTTTKELLAHVLARHGATAATRGNFNSRRFGGTEATLLAVRPQHRFAVIEAAVGRPGDMTVQARMLRPHIAVMLDVKRCHTNIYRSEAAIAEQKRELIRGLAPGAIAVLNLDNPYVAAMAADAPGPVIGFGRSEGARLRLLEASARWPERLTLRILVDGREYGVRTRLVGTQWAGAVLATLAAARACGVPLEQAIAAVGEVEPFWARMQPIRLPDSGAVMLRDEFNGSIDTFEAAFTVLEEASAARKVLVVSDYSDSSAKLRTRAKRLGRRAARVADLLVFVGEYAEQAAQAAVLAGAGKDNVHAVASIPQATELLRGELREGDLVLLKGQANHHLSRIYLGLLAEIECSALACGRQYLCDRCPELGMRSRPILPGLMAPRDSMV